MIHDVPGEDALERLDNVRISRQSNVYFLLLHYTTHARHLNGKRADQCE